MSLMEQNGDVTKLTSHRGHQSPFDHDAIAEYLKTHSVNDTARHFGCSNSVASKIKTRRGIESPNGNQPKLTAQEVGWMQELRDDYYTLEEIAEKFECSVCLVSKLTSSPKGRLSLTKLLRMAEVDEYPEQEVTITHGRKVIGTFTPVGAQQ